MFTYCYVSLGKYLSPGEYFQGFLAQAQVCQGSILESLCVCVCMSVCVVYQAHMCWGYSERVFISNGGFSQK